MYRRIILREIKRVKQTNLITFVRFLLQKSIHFLCNSYVLLQDKPFDFLGWQQFKSNDVFYSHYLFTE